MKGIILAGGLGTRLYPATRFISKQLLPVYNKPMIYYPLCTLMLAGIRDILIITTPKEADLFREFLGDGENWGINLSYAIQPQPDGIAHAFIIAENFIAQDKVCLMLGDNIIYGDNLIVTLKKAAENPGATIFGYYVSDPERYGVIQFDQDNQPCDIIEKPRHYISNYAVPGLYFYDENVVSVAKNLLPSSRGELEITDVNRYYLQQNRLNVIQLGRGYAWLDMGTHKSLLDAANFIYVLEERQGLKIGSPEEVAWRMNYINTAQLGELINKSSYHQYLIELTAHESN